MQNKRNFSAKREAIYKTIAESTEHPAAEWIYESLKPDIPDLSLGTVYRNIAVFKEMGIIKSVGVYNGLERYDCDVQPHSHFICTKCFCISDIPKGRNFIDNNMYDFVEKECGGKVTEHSAAFFGICSKCLEKSNVGIG